MDDGVGIAVSEWVWWNVNLTAGIDVSIAFLSHCYSHLQSHPYSPSHPFSPKSSP